MTGDPIPCRAEASGGAIPLWECPCRGCWSLECTTYDYSREDATPAPTYAQWVAGFGLEAP
jgi:hypothetical protein